MYGYLRFLLLSSAFYPLFEGILPLQAMDTKNPLGKCDFRSETQEEEKTPLYIKAKTTGVLKYTTKFKYTPCFCPTEIDSPSNDKSRPESSLLIPGIIQEDLAAKIVEVDDSAIQQSFSPSSANWVSVKDPSQWPHRIHGHLTMKFGGNEKNFKTGSGILVGPNHVLTAAHNLYNNGRWAQEVWFAPARKGKEFFHGYSKGAILLCPDEYIDKKTKDLTEYDYALVILDQAIGRKIGWSGLLYAPDIYFKEWEITVTGYPGEKGSKNYYSTEMWEGSSQPKLSSKKIEYDVYTSVGQSGGAIWRTWPMPASPDPNSIFTIGIHTEGEAKNHGVRLTEESFDKIIEWIQNYNLTEDNFDSIVLQPRLLACEGTAELYIQKIYLSVNRCLQASRCR